MEMEVTVASIIQTTHAVVLHSLTHPELCRFWFGFHEKMQFWVRFSFLPDPFSIMQCDFRFGLFFRFSFRFRFANYFFVLVSF